jgi:hypothetical protein
MQSSVVLDVIVGESAAVFKLLAAEDEALMLGMDALPIIDLVLDGVDGVGGLDFKSDCFSSQKLQENLHFLWILNELL